MQGHTVVVEQGGTSWWIPFVTALFVALVAALASYYATWRFKRSDVDRENAFRAADLIDEAERTVAVDETGASATARLLRQALRRTAPIDDLNLDDAFFAAVDYNEYLQRWKQPPDRAAYWQGQAIANIREALTPHLSAPRLVRRKEQGIRLFPKQEELFAMPTDDPQGFMSALARWQSRERHVPDADDPGQAGSQHLGHDDVEHEL
jgi:hypothetical protein